MKQQKNILNEKRILEMMDHPFVLKLAGCYHDNAEVRGAEGAHHGYAPRNAPRHPPPPRHISCPHYLAISTISTCTTATTCTTAPPLYLH